MAIFHYCPACGAKLPPPDAPPDRLLAQRCPTCGAVHHQNAKPCAGALVVRDGKVLLGRRAVEPYRGWWDLPGGFLEPWETPAEAVVREVREETGLVVRPTELLGVIVDAYTASEGSDYTLNHFYLAEVLAGEPTPADDLAELAWFPPDALPGPVAFACQRQVLAEWRRRVLGGHAPTTGEGG
jgi:ADP-ribose pyrophosphatase YjhB (NUDIX family)